MGGRGRSRTAVDASENVVACVVLGSPSPTDGGALEFRGAGGRGSGTAQVGCTARGGRSFSCRNRTTTFVEKSTESIRTMFLLVAGRLVVVKVLARSCRNGMSVIYSNNTIFIGTSQWQQLKTS